MLPFNGAAVVYTLQLIPGLCTLGVKLMGLIL